MELRVLGAHNLESRTTRFESHLIDGALALDAGSLTRALTLEEQSRVRAVLLSHRHFDHVRDLPALGLALLEMGGAVEVWGIQDTLDYVASRLLDAKLYPDLLRIPSPDRPVLRLRVLQPCQPVSILGYTITAVPVPHTVPAVGYFIQAGDRNLFYTGDAGKGLGAAWRHVAPRALLTEITYGDRHLRQAVEWGHMTPSLLREALEELLRRKQELPRVIVTHMSPTWEKEVRSELAALAQSLRLDLTVSHADMAIQL